ncbi:MULTISPECIES: monovalent cation/H(+) antiporter subunit G [Actinoalloteichus]|uniref:Monovalent cation/proton antiporter, MnhG/PhaG subunit n=1 Tax=Actinoalloteichus fjordicus TaxID=1612552 RepID=A0AAC9PUT3_9PSEU|nr:MULTISPECIES: monovalent cation/H(+) antiporter subunit G [Actinoalloteichus]APU17437.1 monovalent cation/proton antiporter, MnhG/PhaG subunit [Actinoalloteichus fjordicus]APU23523.1 monovalent cation/proton antiporter, MnhG/PhaG subunit [Actinoalloteichus sp. GBA129-24]
MSLADVVSSICLIGGAMFCVLGALGVLWFPDVTSRLQAATKPQTLGLLLLLIGTAIQLEFIYASGLILVGLFQMITAPVLSQMVGRAAYRSGAIRSESLVIDELGERLAKEKRGESGSVG